MLLSFLGFALLDDQHRGDEPHRLVGRKRAGLLRVLDERIVRDEDVAHRLHLDLG